MLIFSHPIGISGGCGGGCVMFLVKGSDRIAVTQLLGVHSLTVWKPCVNEDCMVTVAVWPGWTIAGSTVILVGKPPKEPLISVSVIGSVPRFLIVTASLADPITS